MKSKNLLEGFASSITIKNTILFFYFIALNRFALPTDNIIKEVIV